MDKKVIYIVLLFFFFFLGTVIGDKTTTKLNDQEIDNPIYDEDSSRVNIEKIENSFITSLAKEIEVLINGIVNIVFDVVKGIFNVFIN